MSYTNRVRDGMINPDLSNSDMKSLWLLVELSPINIQSMVWFIMRKSGMRYTDIGKAFGVSKQAVQQAVQIFNDRLTQL